MKVIDLLNKIANNEEIPDKIYYKAIYTYDKELKDYVYEFYDGGVEETEYLFCKVDLVSILNDEIEIIEEKPKKIEEIKKRYDKQAIINYKQANFNSSDMKEICKTIGFLMQYLDEARNTINDLTKAVNYLLEKESDK